MNLILRTILMNPRWTLGIALTATAACLGLAILLFAASAKIESLSDRLEAANLVIDTQTAAAEGIAALARTREDLAADAVSRAEQAGRHDREAAKVYLNLPLPAPEMRCEAAQALVDAAIREGN